MQKLYVSFDIETDGPTPVVNNLLSIGLYAKRGEKVILEEEFHVKPLEGHVQDTETMDFWKKNPLGWQKATENPEDYKLVFKKISDLLAGIARNYNIVFVAGPACFDWMFFKCYYEMANDGNFWPIGFQCMCLSTTWNLYKLQTKMDNNAAWEMKKKFIDGNHTALGDAKNQDAFYKHVVRQFI